MSAMSETPLILFEFHGDDYDYGMRERVITAVLNGDLPAEARMFGASTGRRVSGLWWPHHAPAVRAWAEANGIRVTGPLLAV